ncbi:histidine kinase [Diplocloster modestus]|uniref:Stage 0 sporulation protein A homolog n=1 Tax=Diplocloster modestus TaxID=2850322 RepID=A0ABS6KAL4_9FIRM|nr:histidine kinase [Diplocloster modestus]MBU9727554.1 histidine kinase [Diplocloster modestus]
MNRKIFVPHLITFITAFWAIYLVAFITRCQLQLFHHALFVRQSRLHVDWVINHSLIFKLTASIILCVFGIGCYLIHLLAVENNIFLHLSRLCFLSSGMISCVWEINTMFTTPKTDRLIWIKSGDLFLILFSVQAVTLLMRLLIKNVRPLFSSLLYGLSLPFTAAMILLPPVKALKALHVYLILFFIFGICFCGYLLYLQAGHILKMIFSTSLLVFLGYTVFTISRARDDPGLVQYHSYLPRILLLLLTFLIFLFSYGFREYRNRIFYNKTLNRKIHEANQFKEETLDHIMKFTQAPLNRISGLSEVLLEDISGNLPDNQKKILLQMQSVVKSLNTLMDNLHTYSILQGKTVSLDMMKVSFSTILEMAIDDIVTGDELVRADRIHYSMENTEDYIYGDPYYLMQVNYNFLLALLDIRNQEPIQIQTGRQKDRLCIRMSVTIGEGKMKKVQRIKRILNNRSAYIRENLNSEEELTTIIARNLLLMQNGELKAFTSNQKFFIINYSIPVWNDQGQASPHTESPAAAPSSGYKVILISTLPEQIELIKSFLEYSAYDLVIFHTSEDALQYMEHTRHIGVILIGTTFLKMSSLQIIQNIRRQFSMGQMPVILIRKEVFGQLADPVLSQINDILVETFTRKELLWKIECAIYLKKSVSMALKSRIDFLQSQMDPHFIFNAISTIMPLCMEAPDKAYDLLDSFSNYLRGSLFAGELQKSVSLSKELELVQAYLKIETARFHEMISYSINVNCNDSTKILPLMIEPIVENSVKHGRRGTQKLTIQIDVIQDDDWIYIQIQDDGAGISPERLEQIQEMNTQTSIGLANLIKRLKLYYNETLNIISEQGHGTTVSFRIPCHTADMQEN